MLMALLVGAALGLSGAIFQAVTGNPLGSPEIVGVNFGAYTGALTVLVTLGSGYYAVAAGALIGGLATALTRLRTNPRYEQVLDLVHKGVYAFVTGALADRLLPGPKPVVRSRRAWDGRLTSLPR